jgi:phosphatidylinositol alpha-mannosyltransferase
VLGLARELGRLGHEATILAPLDAPSANSHVVGLGRSLPVRANGSVAPVALGPTASVRALRALRQVRFDVVHLHEPLAPGASYALLTLSGRPMVGTFHRSGGSVLYTVLRPAARALAARLEVRCAVSEAARDTAEKALGGRYEIVGNGVDVERFSEADPWPTEGPTVMFVGRHEPRKGLAVLLEAFSRVDKPRAVCWIAGQGPETARLKEAYPPSRSFLWLGPIDDAELARRLRGAQVACFPSLGGESFGVVLLEAMAAGSAIVASDLPGYRSVADRCVRFVRPGDVGELASGLRIALADAERDDGASSPDALEAGRAHAAGFSMAIMAGCYVSVYEEAIGRSGRR